MKNLFKPLLSVALLSSAAAVHAAPVTYNFTAVITSFTAGTSGLSVGQTLSGTYTFNYDSTDVLIGTPGPASAPFSIGSSGIPYDPVVKTTVSGYYASSSSAPDRDPDDASVVTGNGFTTFLASESTPAFDMGSWLNITQAVDNSVPYTSTGYPTTLTSSQQGVGGFETGGGTVHVYYQLTSLTPAATPTAAVTPLESLFVNATGATRMSGLSRSALTDKLQVAQSYAVTGATSNACLAMSAVVAELDQPTAASVKPAFGHSLKKQAQAAALKMGCTG